MKAKQILMLAALFAMLSVIIGAFASHGLKQSLSAKELSWISTAATYQMYHGLALFGVGLLMLNLGESIWAKVSGCCFILGVVLFSGSLYALAFGAMKGLVYLTPLGGVFFILGWCSLMLAIKGVKVTPAN